MLPSWVVGMLIIVDSSNGLFFKSEIHNEDLTIFAL